MLVNPNPDQWFALPDGTARQFLVAYLIPSFPGSQPYLSAKLYKTADDLAYFSELCDVALGYFDCAVVPPVDVLWDKMHAFALQTFAGFTIEQTISGSKQAPESV